MSDILDLMASHVINLNSFDTITLYHGSKGGIRGDIRPIARPECDFGSGFYMGTKKLQAETLVCRKNDAFIVGPPGRPLPLGRG